MKVSLCETTSGTSKNVARNPLSILVRARVCLTAMNFLLGENKYFIFSFRDCITFLKDYNTPHRLIS